MPIYRSLLSALVFALWSLPASASTLNPCLRVLTVAPSGLAQRPINGLNLCTAAPQQLQSAVHEHMTVGAIYKYRAEVLQRGAAVGDETAALNYMTEAPWRVGSGLSHRTYALVFGTWWNDDPLMHLWGERTDFVSGLKHLKRLFDKRRRSLYEGGVAGCPVAANQHLGRASHFDALQYLHFMSNLPRSRSDEERLQSTLDEALNWIEFAYRVATGEIAASAAFTADDERRLKMPSIAANLCLKDVTSVKVRSVFTRQGPPTSANIAYRNGLAPDIALGTIFHVLQDSFSPAHTCRIAVQADGQKLALLKRVFNYNEQTPEEHAALDGYPAWLQEYARAGTHRYTNDPIVVGAWLLGAVDSKLPWPDVRKHLLSTIFRTQPPQRDASSDKCI
jgi:hypothetical protein